MPYCGHCGSEVSAEAAVCLHCGCAVNQPPYQTFYRTPYQPIANPDRANTGLNLLAFFIPVVGAFLYLFKYQQYPIQAQAIGKWALIGYAVRMVFSALIFLLFFFLACLGSIL